MKKKLKPHEEAIRELAALDADARARQPQQDKYAADIEKAVADYQKNIAAEVAKEKDVNSRGKQGVAFNSKINT